MTNVEFLSIVNRQLDLLKEECERCENWVKSAKNEEKEQAEYALRTVRITRDKLKKLIEYPVYERIKAMSLEEVEKYRIDKLKEAEEELRAYEKQRDMFPDTNWRYLEKRDIYGRYNKLQKTVETYQKGTPEEIKNMWLERRFSSNQLDEIKREINYVSEYGMGASPEFTELYFKDFNTMEKVDGLLSELRYNKYNLKKPFVRASVWTYSYPEGKEKEYYMGNEYQVESARDKILKSEKEYEEIMQMYSSGILKLNRFYNLCSFLKSQINEGKIDENLINNLCKLGDDSTYSAYYNKEAEDLLFRVKRLNKNSKKIIKTYDTKTFIDEDKNVIKSKLEKMYEYLYDENMLAKRNKFDVLGLQITLLPKPFEEVRKYGDVPFDFSYWVNEMNNTFNRYRESFAMAKEVIAKEQEKISIQEERYQNEIDKNIKEIEELVGVKYEKLPYDNSIGVKTPAHHGAIFNVQNVMDSVKYEAQNQADMALADIKGISVAEVRKQRQAELNQMREELLNMTESRDSVKEEQENKNNMIR